ncbi:MAG: permease [Candidatus Omnitrophica bacterium]|nr:permease [Candidatus Omnitrophota bacterium]
MKIYLFLSKYIIVVLFGLFLFISRIFNFKVGIHIYNNFWMFFTEMIAFLPLMFILIGLFDIWISKEKIERHIGQESGIKGMFLAIVLAMLQAGPLYGAFPVAYLLFKKGCSMRNIFIYLGAFSTLKIPMLTFEIGFLGLKFSLLRTIFTLPVFIIISIIMEEYLKNKNFYIKDGVSQKTWQNSLKKE